MIKSADISAFRDHFTQPVWDWTAVLRKVWILLAKNYLSYPVIDMQIIAVCFQLGRFSMIDALIDVNMQIACLSDVIDIASLFWQ